MKNFMEHDFNISEFSLAVFVPAESSDVVHKNRKFHGIVYSISGIKKYLFDNNKTVIVREKEFLYLPKNSNYIVKIIEPGGCYAINFDFDDNIYADGFSFKVKNQSVMLDFFSRAERECRTKKAGYNMRCKAILYNILAEIQTEYNLESVSYTHLDVYKRQIQRWTGTAVIFRRTRTKKVF